MTNDDSDLLIYLAVRQWPYIFIVLAFGGGCWSIHWGMVGILLAILLFGSAIAMICVGSQQRKERLADWYKELAERAKH